MMKALTAHSLFGVTQVIIHGRLVLWSQDEPGQQKKKKRYIFIIFFFKQQEQQKNPTHFKAILEKKQQ